MLVSSQSILYAFLISTFVRGSDILTLRGGSTAANVQKLTKYNGNGPAVSKKQPDHRSLIYERERDFLLKVKELGLDSESFPSLLSFDDKTNTIFITFLDDTKAPFIRTVQYKDNITSILFRLALKHGLFHNDVKWDNIIYDTNRKQPVFIDFDWSTRDNPGYPFYGPLQLPIRVARHSGARSLCALHETRAESRESFFLFSLNDTGHVIEHERHSTGWASRELKIPTFQTISAAFDKHSSCRLLYGADRDGRIWEVSQESLHCPVPYDDNKIHEQSTIQCLILSSTSVKLLYHDPCHRTTTKYYTRTASGDNSSVGNIHFSSGHGAESSRLWACVRVLFFIGDDGHFRAVSLDYAGQWTCERILPPPNSSCLPATDGSGFSFVAMAPPADANGTRAVFVYYIGQSKRLCELVWDGPGRACMREVHFRNPSCEGYDPWGRINAMTLTAIAPGADASNATVYFSDNHRAWECRLNPGRGNASLGILKALWWDREEEATDFPRGERIYSSAIPRSREEGGGFAGRELVSAWHNGYLTRCFLGGSCLERKGSKWRAQELTHRRMRSGLIRLRLPASTTPLAILATEGGAHFILYADEDGNVVEL